jgi:aromatic ring-opening dioxygenase LigB subunit
MFVFAAVVPHSPLLVPSIGKEHREKLAATLAAYRALEEALYLSRPDAIVVVSPHAQMYPDAFSGNVADTFKGGLKEFGDHGTELTAKMDFMLLDHIHRHMREENVPFTLSSSPDIDYAFTIPLLLLTPHLTHWKLVPIATSLLDNRAHVEFGKQLKRVLHAESARVALIASADLSHHVNANAPKGMLPEGAQFDTAIREKLRANDLAGLLALPQTIVEKAESCGLKPILTLMGALNEINVQTKELCYEAPFGVGYLTEQFIFA